MKINDERGMMNDELKKAEGKRFLYFSVFRHPPSAFGIIHHSSFKIHNSKGFTLIEMMIAVAIIGIMACLYYPMHSNTKKLAEDHFMFTRCAAALSMQMEIMKTKNYRGLRNGDGLPLDPKVIAALLSVPESEGDVSISNDPRTGMKRIKVEVRWPNPWDKQRSLKSVLLRSGP